MIRLSSPEVARGSPGPKASRRSTWRPRSDAVSAIHVPMTPAPTTTRSGDLTAGSALQLGAEAALDRGPHDGVGEDQIGQANAEVGDNDAALGSRRPGEDGLTDRRVR